MHNPRTHSLDKLGEENWIHDIAKQTQILCQQPNMIASANMYIIVDISP